MGRPPTLPLADIADAYRRLIADGRPRPGARLAAAFGVPQSTARSWIHRARLAGLLGEQDRYMSADQLAASVIAAARVWRDARRDRVSGETYHRACVALAEAVDRYSPSIQSRSTRPTMEDPPCVTPSAVPPSL